jgi:hypothetical protein
VREGSGEGGGRGRGGGGHVGGGRAAAAAGVGFLRRVCVVRGDGDWRREGPPRKLGIGSGDAVRLFGRRRRRVVGAAWAPRFCGQSPGGRPGLVCKDDFVLGSHPSTGSMT